MSFRTKVLTQVMLSKPYLFYFWSIFIGYLIINAFINQVHITLGTFLRAHLWIVIPYIVFSLLVAFLVALNVNLVIYKINVEKKHRAMQGTSVGALGAFIGLLAGACPGCFVGLFPAFMGIFGVTLSLGALPFFGIEIQVLSFLLLLLGAYLLTKEIQCELPRKKNEKKVT